MRVTQETVARMVEVKEEVCVARLSGNERDALIRALRRAASVAERAGNSLDVDRFNAVLCALVNPGVDCEVPE